MYGLPTVDNGDLAARRDAARGGRAAAMSRRRALAAGRSALAPARERVRTGFREAELRAPTAAVDPTPTAAPDSREAPSGAQGAPGGTAVATDGVDAAHLGCVLSMPRRRMPGRRMQRRRQLSQGKQALNGDGDRTVVATYGATVGVVDAHLGRTLSMQHRRQLSKGKQALNGHVDRTAAADTGPPALIVHRGGGC